jgi:multiple antibiotic resistance protein
MGNSLIAYTFGTFTALFPIANPMGATFIFYSLTVEDTYPYRLVQARKTALNVIGILSVFLLLGNLILHIYGISLGLLQVIGGLIVSHTGWKMIIAKRLLTEAQHLAAMDKDDVSFTPMAIPLISGPGAIGVVINQAAEAKNWIDYLGCFLGIILLGGLTYLFLRSGQLLIKNLGKTGIEIAERLFGFLTLVIAFKLIADGTFALLKTNTQ